VRRNADSVDSLETTSLTYDVSISFFDFLNKGDRTIQMNEEINSIKLLLYKKRIYFNYISRVFPFFFMSIGLLRSARIHQGIIGII
jgi:hypothetical protein